MQIHTLDDVDAFWVLDIDHATSAAGVVRSAPKVLRDGAVLLARSLTYGFACLEVQVSGASCAVNAKPDVRADALGAFVAQMAPLTAEGRLLIDPGKGVDPVALEALRAVDPRPALHAEARQRLAGASAAAGAAATTELGGASVAIEHLDDVSVAFAAAVVERGAKVVAIATPAGTATSSEGFAADAIAGAWADHGTDAPRVLASGEPDASAVVLAMDVDVLAVGSKAGVIDHVVAPQLGARTVVPVGPVPVSARALAMLGRSGTVVLPDFVCLLGGIVAMGLGGSVPPADEAAAREHVEAVVGEILGAGSAHPEGPLVAACERAEQFLGTWCDSLPFGRPIA